jgi:lysozyme family protein
MTVEEIINGILDREKEQKPPYLAKGDRGGRTNWGISERAHPEVWMSGPPDRARAYRVYLNEYVKPWDWVTYEPLKVQLIDCGVLHGQSRAVKLLQQTVGVTVDGKAGIMTRHAVNGCVDSWTERLLNNALVAFRLKFIDELSDASKSQKINEEGWENRSLLFLV